MAVSSDWKTGHIEQARAALDELDALCIKDDPTLAGQLARQVLAAATALHESAMSADPRLAADQAKCAAGDHMWVPDDANERSVCDVPACSATRPWPRIPR